MKVRPWEDVLATITEEDVSPADWRAVAGQRRRGVGEDLYLAHPTVGMFLLKTYAKNPFEVRGVGGKVARRVDEDLAPVFPEPETPARFAVQQQPSDPEAAANEVGAVLEAHADAPTTPLDCFDDVMEALESPAFGPMDNDPVDRPDALSTLAERVSGQERELEEALESRLESDGVTRGFE